MRAAGYRYLHSRKKGVLTRKDLNIRYKFAKKVGKLLAPTVWKDGIAFYLDGVGFTHKVNPRNQSLAPRTMAWRRPRDGLSYNQTAKGSHEGSGVRTANFLVAVAYKRGVLCAEQYHGQLNGQTFADFIREKFPTLFEQSCNQKANFSYKTVTHLRIVKRHKILCVKLVLESFLSLLVVLT